MSRRTAIIICILVAIIAAFVCGIAAAWAGGTRATFLAWSGGGFAGACVIGLTIVGLLFSGEGQHRAGQEP